MFGRAEPFTRFLLEQSEYKVLSQDQWVGFLRFTQEARTSSRCSWQSHLLCEVTACTAMQRF